MVSRKSRAEIERMSRAGRIVAEVLALVEEELQAGVTTAHLDLVAERHIAACDATPSFKRYLGNGRYGEGPRSYPASICVSIDEEVVHGIPGPRVIQGGQIVSIDAGAIVDGWHADAARTFVVGEATPDAKRLVEATNLALMAGIAAARPGGYLGDISGAIEDVAVEAGFGIVRNFVGHGIGTQMHEEPQVPNYRTGGRGIRLEPGICLAIEPMLTVGSPDVEVRDDHWTVATVDGSLAAHFEHTIAITEDGPRVLTAVA
jgi:methionyl aminopeptidase